MTSRFWRMYAHREFYKWEKTVLWDMIEPYRRPKSFTPVVSVYIAAFYTGVIGSALTEQLYKVSRIFYCMRAHRQPYMPTKLAMAEVLYVLSKIVGMAREKYWEEHPGEAVPIMRPKFYWGHWRVYRGQELPPDK